MGILCATDMDGSFEIYMARTVLEATNGKIFFK